MVMALRIDVAGLVASLDGLAAKADLAAVAGANAAAAVAEASIKRQLSLRSHRKGTPTPSPRGAPPAVITGTLRRSVITERRPGYVAVGPTAVYARIHELGGTTGRHGATTLPERPYVTPAYKASSADMQTAALAAIRRTLSV